MEFLPQAHQITHLETCEIKISVLHVSLNSLSQDICSPLIITSIFLPVEKSPSLFPTHLAWRRDNHIVQAKLIGICRSQLLLHGWISEISRASKTDIAKIINKWRLYSQSCLAGKR